MLGLRHTWNRRSLDKVTRKHRGEHDFFLTQEEVAGVEGWEEANKAFSWKKNILSRRNRKGKECLFPLSFLKVTRNTLGVKVRFSLRKVGETPFKGFLSQTFFSFSNYFISTFNGPCHQQLNSMSAGNRSVLFHGCRAILSIRTIAGIQ